MTTANKFIADVARAHALGFQRTYTSYSEKTGLTRCKLYGTGTGPDVDKVIAIVCTALPHAKVRRVPGFYPSYSSVTFYY